ncbi:proline--tRNA ligase [Zhaonella formicivorans]|uniref:proline--tRNA ligase n=1 Tax=Zhaonella formicivorans TaxID=2528593 RepID=UPI0010EF9E58|nr:proline--tRNA ligase [Zhaonella formicivorans]
MRVSALMLPTLREVPAEAEVISHKLLVRAGMIRKSAAGIYSYLPLGWRVMQKIAAIIREEMDRAGGQELLLPIVQPAELWLESGRWNVYGAELFRLKDRHQRDFCLGPTHEEIITDLVRREVSSYKQLPLLLYQIQSKFRDERRPRFGLMRGREFMMKDLYSFDRDEEGLKRSYQKMYDAYVNVFTRCGLTFRPVEADSGAIGGSATHEFMVLANSGEAEIVYCEECNYAANVERAKNMLAEKETEEFQSLELLYTPDVHTIEQLVDFVNLPAERLLKTLFYDADGKIICAVVRGDREVNEIKLQNLLGCLELKLASDDAIEQLTGSTPGFVGPIGLQGVSVYVDEEVVSVVNGVAGANKVDHHYLNVNYGRDFSATDIVDIRVVRAGDLCPRCGATLNSARGIEVGQIFQLGTKYSKALGANFVDEKGQEQPIVMGCYGIGVGRTMAAAVEQNHDEKGIIWPLAIAPFEVVVVPVSSKEEIQMELANKVYQELKQAGVDVVLDDRDERAGVKFSDADLIGYPYRITIGKKTVSEHTVDLKHRATGEEETISLDNVVEHVIRLVK